MDSQVEFFTYENRNTNTYELEILWTIPGVGFGEAKLSRWGDGKVTVSTEYMGKEFVKKLISDLIDQAELDD